MTFEKALMKDLNHKQTVNVVCSHGLVVTDSNETHLLTLECFQGDIKIQGEVSILNFEKISCSRGSIANGIGMMWSIVALLLT